MRDFNPELMGLRLRHEAGLPCPPPAPLPGGGVMLRLFLDDRTYGILCEVSRRMGRTVEDLAESSIADTAIQSIPPQAR